MWAKRATRVGSRYPLPQIHHGFRPPRNPPHTVASERRDTHRFAPLRPRSSRPLSRTCRRRGGGVAPPRSRTPPRPRRPWPRRCRARPRSRRVPRTARAGPRGSRPEPLHGRLAVGVPISAAPSGARRTSAAGRTAAEAPVGALQLGGIVSGVCSGVVLDVMGFLVSGSRVS